MIRRLEIPETVLEAMVGHARRVSPAECCGILSGRGERVELFHPVTNVDASELTYRLAPDEQFRVFREIRRDGRSLLAIFHSHPASPPYPSPTDIRQAFFPGTREPNYPDAVYVIMSLAGAVPETRAFRIGPDGVAEIPIDVV